MSNKVSWQALHWRQVYTTMPRRIGRFTVAPYRIFKAVNGCYDRRMQFVTDGIEPDEIIVVVNQRDIYVVGVTPTPTPGSCREFHVNSCNADPRAWQDAPGWSNDDAVVVAKQPVLAYA